MLLRLFLFFTIVPLVELALLIKVGSIIGVMPTLAVVVLTGLFGALLARHQGLKILSHIVADLDAGLLPATSLIEGLIVLIAAALLITPGLLTDALGFLLLVSPLRLWLIHYLRRKMETYLQEKAYRVRFYDL